MLTRFRFKDAHRLKQEQRKIFRTNNNQNRAEETTLTNKIDFKLKCLSLFTGDKECHFVMIKGPTEDTTILKLQSPKDEMTINKDQEYLEWKTEFLDIKIIITYILKTVQ